MNLLDFNADGQINETEYFIYGSFMHLWVNTTGSLNVTEVIVQPDFIPDIVWSYMDINGDGILTLDEFCIAAENTVDFEIMSELQGPFDVAMLGYNDTWQAWADYDQDGMIMFEEWMLASIDVYGFLDLTNGSDVATF